MKYFVNVVAVMAVEAETYEEAVAASSNITQVPPLHSVVFIGDPTKDPSDSGIGKMVRIKETVKEVYAKLKQLHVKKNVHFYYDMLHAILRR